MSHTRIIASRPWFEIGCTLGEGPLYDPTTALLHFVDIAEKKVFHLNTHNFDLSIEQFEDSVTCLTLRKHAEGLGCTTEKGFALIDTDSKLRYLSQPLPINHIAHTRFNDGGCDSKGRFFAGTIFSKDHGVAGKLYRYDPADGTCVVVDEGPFTDSNGLGWSPDEKILYFTDSLNNKIYAYDYDDGHLSNRRVFADAISLGLPENTFFDGLCVDDEGYIWSARWGGSRIIRFTKEGDMDAEVIFPTALNITACCFGGPNNDQLFVTTAHCGAVGGDESRQKDFPDSGHLFRVDFAGRYRGGHRYNFAS